MQNECGFILIAAVVILLIAVYYSFLKKPVAADGISAEDFARLKNQKADQLKDSC